MTYVGNPIDTQNTFQSLVGKRFDGDGSTTAFTLDVAPSSTLDIEVFVGNVRQDPNSAYTLSGTTLTFTGAPPSGTNNIYVVHQAKSVGTITPGANSVGVTELNLSDGSSGQFISTNGSGTLSFASVASLAGIDDQSSSNDDQLTITDTAVVINEDSDDVDFRVESNGNANMLFVSGGNDVVGVGAEGDLGVGLHVKSADSGASVSGDADEFVVESSGHGGISILTGNAHEGRINFGDDGDNDSGFLSYDHSANSMFMGTGGNNIRVKINSDGDVLIGATSQTSSEVLHVTSTSDCAFFKTSAGGEEVLTLHRTNANGTFINFVNSSASTCGSINNASNGSVTTYATSSDYRLKENVDYTFDATTRLKQLKPARFNWIADDTNTLMDGFLAHEVSSVVPEAVVGTKDATETKQKVILDKDGNYLADKKEEADWIKGKEDGTYPSDSTWIESKVFPLHQGIDQSKLVPLLVKTVQELEARIKTLEEA